MEQRANYEKYEEACDVAPHVFELLTVGVAELVNFEVTGTFNLEGIGEVAEVTGDATDEEVGSEECRADSCDETFEPNAKFDACDEAYDAEDDIIDQYNIVGRLWRFVFAFHLFLNPRRRPHRNKPANIEAKQGTKYPNNVLLKPNPEAARSDDSNNNGDVKGNVKLLFFLAALQIKVVIGCVQRYGEG